MNKIEVMVIHDCFIIHKKNEKKIRRYYYQGFLDLISRKTPLLVDLISNNIDNYSESSEITKIISAIYEKKKNLNISNYNMSLYILS